MGPDRLTVASGLLLRIPDSWLNPKLEVWSEPYPKAPKQFFFGQYLRIPKKKMGPNRKGTTLEPLGIIYIIGVLQSRIGGSVFLDPPRALGRSECFG